MFLLVNSNKKNSNKKNSSVKLIARLKYSSSAPTIFFTSKVHYFT